MMKHLVRTSVLALAFPSALFAQAPAGGTAAASATEAKEDIKFVLAGGYAHFFDTDFDTGGAPSPESGISASDGLGESTAEFAS